MSLDFIPCPLGSKSALVENPGLKKSYSALQAQLKYHLPREAFPDRPSGIALTLQVLLLGSGPGIVTEKLCVLGQVTWPAHP